MQAVQDDFLDERLAAFLDGELEGDALVETEALIAADPAMRERLARLGQTDALLREAYDEVLREALPERLLATACGQAAAGTGETLRRYLAGLIVSAKAWLVPEGDKRRWMAMAAAASLAGIVVGTGLGDLSPGQAPASPVSTSWLDNIAGYHNLCISTANGAENTVFDVAPGAEKQLPTDVRVPDLKQWGLNFRGARRIVLEGKPAYQFFYRTTDRRVGPTTVFVTGTDKPELPLTFERRDGVNLIYWRHLGHAYAIVGQAGKGWMFSLANDIAYQTQRS